MAEERGRRRQEERGRRRRQEPSPPVDIFRLLDRETLEQILLEDQRHRQNIREFLARNHERFTVGERVEARLSSETEWRLATITMVRHLVVSNSETRREMNKQPNEVRDIQTRETGETANLRVNELVEMKVRNNWVPGVLISKNYSVQFDGADNIVPLTSRDIRKIGNVTAQPQPVVRPPPPPTAGVAFEIHNAFNNFKFEKFMDIIRKNSNFNNNSNFKNRDAPLKFTDIVRKNSNFNNSNFKNRDAPLQPLIDNINANPNLSPKKKAELAGKIKRIFTTLRQYSNYEPNINNIMDCIQYVLMQPQNFIDNYINTFITDCLKAYATGSEESCIKGMYERVYLSFRDTVSIICLDQIQGTGAAPLCKPEYIEIFDCFYENIPNVLLNEYFKDWHEDRGKVAENLSDEAKIEDFVNYVRGKINNVVRFRQAERSIREYAETTIINTIFGGRSQLKREKKTVKRRKNTTIKKRGNRSVIKIRKY